LRREKNKTVISIILKINTHFMQMRRKNVG